MIIVLQSILLSMKLSNKYRVRGFLLGIYTTVVALLHYTLLSYYIDTKAF